MSYFILIPLLALGLTAAFIFGGVRRTQRSRFENIPGRFDFDAFKNRELVRRGLHDATKWSG